jgi:hypothetical protein
MEHDGQLVERPVGVESRGSEPGPDTNEPWKLQRLQKLLRRSENSRRRQGQRGPLPLPFPLLPPASAAHCGLCRGPRLGHDCGRAVQEPPSPPRVLMAVFDDQEGETVPSCRSSVWSAPVITCRPDDVNEDRDDDSDPSPTRSSSEPYWSW